MSDGADATDATNHWRRFDRIFAVGGGLLFVYLLYELGVSNVWPHLRRAGGGIALVIVQEIFAYGANTLGWWAAFRHPRPKVPAWRLLEARIIGDAINYLTPTAGLGGEFVRARCLGEFASANALAASVSIAKLTQLAGQVVFLCLGLAVILPYAPIPGETRNVMLAGLGLVGVLVVSLLGMQRRGMFGPLLHGLRRLGIVREHPDRAEWLARLDIEIAAYHLDGDRAVLRSICAFTVGWALGLLEMALILWLVGVDVTWNRVVAIEVLSIAFDSLLFFVPAKAGTQEAGKVLIFGALGLDPATGLAVGILRRVRELSWAGFGLALWSRRR